MQTVIDEIAQERQRQINDEGWTEAHDEQWFDGELATAASCYADPDPPMRTETKYRKEPIYFPMRWPWGISWWKPTTRRRDLIKAAALIVAEIERLDRLSSKKVRVRRRRKGGG